MFADAETVGAMPASGRVVLLVVLALVLTALFVFWPSFDALAKLWSHPDRRTYQHGYLVSVLALWLLFRSRHRIVAAAAGPEPVLLAMTAAVSVAWLVAFRAGLQAAHMLLWPAVLWCAITGVLGRRAGRILLAPIAFLYFALPIWDALIPALQHATVFANRTLGAIFGLPMLIEGTYVHIPEGTFEISGGCSGLNYFIVGISVAALLGEINGDSARRRLLLIVLGGGLAILSNWLRVFVIIYAGHLSDMTHYLVRVDHYNFGWVFYAFVLGGFFLIVRRLPESRLDRPPVAARRVSRRPRVAAIIVAFVGLGSGWLVSGAAALRGTDAEARMLPAGILDLDDRAIEQWLQAPAMGDWVPVFPGADSESLLDYTRDGQSITAYAAAYRRQSQGQELIGHDSRIEGSAVGRLQRRGVRTTGGRQGVPAMEGEWRGSSGAHALMWWSYRIGSRVFANGLQAQLWYGISSIWSNPVSAIVVLRAECRPDCAHARTMLQQFAGDAMPAMLVAASRTGERSE